MPFSIAAAPVTPLLDSAGVGGECPRSGCCSSPLRSALGASSKSQEHTVPVHHGPSRRLAAAGPRVWREGSVDSHSRLRSSDWLPFQTYLKEL